MPSNALLDAGSYRLLQLPEAIQRWQQARQELEDARAKVRAARRRFKEEESVLQAVINTASPEGAEAAL